MDVKALSRAAARLRMTALLSAVSGLALAGSAYQAQAAEAAAADEAAPAAVEEVVVTASGREARIQDVAIPITAVTAEAIKNANITDLKVLSNVVPSYRLVSGQSNAAGATAFIRGIGTGGDNAGFESAVGFFIDGVYRNRAGVALSELPEVARIEVLRGPQGTLFGRNTSAGAISVTTKGPEFTPRGFVTAQIGNLNERKGTAMYTGALIDNVLAGRIDVNFQKRDGYIHDINSNRDLNNRNRYSVRGQLFWNINDDASLRVIADTSHTDEQCCVGVYSKTGSFATAINVVAGLRGLTGITSSINPSALTTALTPGRNYLEKVDEWGVSGELNWKIGDVKASSISSYRNWKLLRNQDVDFNGVDRAYREGYTDQFKTFTQELRFQGEVGKLNWLAGGFYASETLPHTDKIRFGADGARYVDALAAGAAPGFNVFGSLGATGCGAASAYYTNCRLFAAQIAPPTVLAGLASPDPVTRATAQGTLALANAYAAAVASGAPVAGTGQNSDNFETKTQSVSLFTHNEINITDRLKWTIGLRFNHEKKDLTANLDATAPGCNALTATPTFAGLTAKLQTTPLGAFLLFACNPVVNTIANGTYATSTTEDEWSGTTSLSYKLAEKVMVYGGYSRGYKAGGYNLDRSGFSISPASTVKPSASELHFKPEFVDAYELGIKSTVWGNTTLNGNVFYEQFTDYQNNAFSGFNFITRNGKITTKGVELDATSRPINGLTLQGGLLYNDSKYDEAVSFGAGGTIAAGTPIAGASKWTVTAATTYKVPVASTGLVGLAYLDGRWVSAYATQTLNPDPSGSTKQGAFAVINGRLGIAPSNQAWSAELFVRNLFDQFYRAGGFGVPEQTGNYAVYPSEPRTYGAQVRVNF